MVMLEDVWFSYAGRPVLQGVTLRLQAGRHYVLAGPNGAGKSTLLGLCAGLRQPDRGHVCVGGHPAAEQTPPDLARVLALAPQEYAAGFDFTVREVTAMGRRPHIGRWGMLGPADHAAVDEALREVHMDALADRVFTTLSGGERRRCIVARALAQSTPVLLLDEPTAGLDIAHALRVMDAARKRARSGVCVLSVSHDLNLAAAWADELIFLKDGQIAAQGPVDDVCTQSVLSDIYQTRIAVQTCPLTGRPAVSFAL